MESTCEAWLTEDEKTAADRFRRPTSRNQHVIGRGMARKLLGGPAVSEATIAFEQLDHGKPRVVTPEQARQPFNVAHTEGLVLCSVADHLDDGRIALGVDVERLERRTSPDLAERYFAEPELDFLRSFDSMNDRQRVFLRIWTLKESFIKAIGTGLHTPLADFAFEEIDSAAPKIRLLNPDLDQSMTWTFSCFTPREGFVAAVAIGDVDGRCKHDVQLCAFEDWLT